MKKIVAIFSLVLAFAFYGKADALTLTPIRIEVSGNPGDVVESEITLINDRDTQQTYYSSFSNFEAQGETGSPNFVDPKEGLGTWMTTDTEVILAPGTSKIIPVSISIPQNAEAGGYFAAVFFGTGNPNAEPGTIAIGAKTGVLVLLRVNGEVNEEGGILEFSTKDKDKFFTALPVSFYYRFQNSGGDRVKPEGNITIKHLFGFTRAVVPANLVEGNVLPNQIRRFDAVWQSKNGSSTEKGKMTFFGNVKNEWQNFAFGYYKANLSLTYGENKQTTESHSGFWVFPWHLLLTLAVLIVLTRFVWRKLSRKHRETIMKEMREEIIKEMEGGKSGDKNNHIQF